MPFRFVHLELLVVDERQAREHVSAGRNVSVEIVIELPESRERAERDVELPLRPFAGLPRHAEDLADFGAHGHRHLSGRAIQLLDVAAFFPHAHQRVEPIELVEGGLECRRWRHARPRSTR